MLYADGVCHTITTRNKNMLVPWYLIACYAYYVDDQPVLTDQMFDQLAKTLHDNWDDVNHMHKSALSRDDCRAGTFLGKYPPRVQYAVADIRARLK